MAADGGRNAARGLRYQYLRTLEALLDVVERDDGAVGSVHVEGLGGPDSQDAEGVDFELAGEDGRIVAAVQVKARAPGYAMGAGEVFGALAALVQERDACRYQLLTNAIAGASAGELLAVLGAGRDASLMRSLLDGVLASVSADRRRAQLRGLGDDQVLRLSRSQASFDAREDTEIRDGLITRLRRYRNQRSAGLGDESAGLMVGYLLSEIFRRAGDAGEAAISVGEFKALVMASGAVLAGTLGRRDWGVVVGRVPVVPDVRRSDLLDQVRAALGLPAVQAHLRRCALTGMSGIGKTSLAASYVLDRADVYDVVFWIDGESELTLTSSFERVFRYLRDGRDGQGSLLPPDPARLRDAVHDELSQASGTWLMVLDNCVRPSLAEQWIPGSGTGHVIVTTTDSSRPPKAGVNIEVGTMAIGQATLLLGRRLGTAPDGLLELLAGELECWPLALELAAAYLHSSGLGAAGIRAYLRRLKLRSLGDPRSVPADYPRTLIQAIRLCLDRVREQALQPGPQQAPAGAALAVISLAAYVAAQRIPVHLLLSAVQIDPGTDAFRGMDQVIADDTGCPAEEVLATLRAESLAGTDEMLPSQGLDDDHDRRLDLTMTVNSVLQEVIRAWADQHTPTLHTLDNLAWHTERWLKASFELGARSRAAILSAHAAAIDQHAARLGLSTDFIEYLRGNLGTLYLRQRNLRKAESLLRGEISHFAGRPEDHARVLTCQATIQLAFLLTETEPLPSAEIIELLERAYQLVYESAIIAPEAAAFLAGTISAVLQNLEMRQLASPGHARLAAAVQSLIAHLPATPATEASAALIEAEIALQREDPQRAARICQAVLADAASADEVDLTAQTRCEARRILIEALLTMNDLDGAATELDLFLEYAQPPAFFITHIEQLVHNAGIRCALLAVVGNLPIAANLLARLLGNGNAQLIQDTHPGQTGARISLLDAACQFTISGTDQARQKLNTAAGNVARYAASSPSAQGDAWKNLATLLTTEARA